MLKKWALSRPLSRTPNLTKFKIITFEVKKNTHYIFKSKHFYRWIFSTVWILVSDIESSASVDVRVLPSLRCQFLELGSKSKKISAAPSSFSWNFTKDCMVNWESLLRASTPYIAWNSFIDFCDFIFSREPMREFSLSPKRHLPHYASCIGRCPWFKI